MRQAAGSRARPAPLETTVVEVWGADPTGSDQMYAIIDAIAGPLQGTSTTPPGWGLAGSDEETDYHVWASPQAFTGAGGLTAHYTWHEGGGTPVVYDAESDYDFDVVTIPDQVSP